MTERKLKLFATVSLLICVLATYGQFSRGYLLEWKRHDSLEWPAMPNTRSTTAIGSFDLLFVRTVNMRSCTFTGKFVEIPMYPLAILGAIVPAMLFTRWQRRIWQDSPAKPTGYCTVCGYDLRATPDRCPECGTENHLPMEVRCDADS